MKEINSNRMFDAFKLAFGVAMGWNLGKFMFDFTLIFTDRFIKNLQKIQKKDKDEEV